MSTLLNKSYLVKVSTKGGGGVKNTPNSVYVVCTQPHMTFVTKVIKNYLTTKSLRKFFCENNYQYSHYTTTFRKCKPFIYALKKFM